MSAATGPKTSSRAMRSSGPASTSVHGYQKPVAVGRVAAEERLALDERRHRLAVRRRDERPHLRLVELGVAHLHAPRRLDEQLGEAVVGGVLDEDARARAAVLAGVVEHRVRRGRRGALEVGVREHDVRRLAAELERHALDRSGRAAHDRLPHLGRAGEADLRDVGVLDEPLPDDRALAGDDVDDALRDARLERELGEPQRRQRRQLRRLQHDGVPARQAPGRASTRRC